MSIFHPLRNHGEFGRREFGCYAFDRQNIWMFHPLANYDFLAIVLDKASPINVNPQSSCFPPFLSFRQNLARTYEEF